MPEKKSDEIVCFFNEARKYCIKQGYQDEIKWVAERKFENVDSNYFLLEYVFVVLSSGMKNQIARKIYDKFIKDFDLNVIGHKGKREAVASALVNYKEWFSNLKKAGDKIEYLDTLPFIGGITKYHLARNLGIDVAKPDRHLVRLAEKFGYGDVQIMCNEIAEKTGERIGVVDVILWRYCNLQG